MNLESHALQNDQKLFLAYKKLGWNIKKNQVILFAIKRPGSFQYA
jgi:hypothetical protein